MLKYTCVDIYIYTVLMYPVMYIHTYVYVCVDGFACIYKYVHLCMYSEYVFVYENAMACVYVNVKCDMELQLSGLARCLTSMYPRSACKPLQDITISRDVGF